MTPTFGALLRKARHASDKPLRDVAAFLRMSVPYVSDVERGNRSPFRLEVVVRLAEFLGAPAEPLLLAAVEGRGGVELGVNGDPRVQRFAVQLALRWSSLSGEDAGRLAGVLGVDDMETT